MLSIISTVWDLIKSVFGIVSGTEQAQAVAEEGEVVAVTQASAEVQVKWWFVAAIPPLFAIPCIIYEWKIIVWDKVLAYYTNGTTDPLDPHMWWVFTIIVGFYFFHSVISGLK